MKYTQKQRLEMLEEMWQEINAEFCKQMVAKQTNAAEAELKKLNLIIQLQALIKN